MIVPSRQADARAVRSTKSIKSQKDAPDEFSFAFRMNLDTTTGWSGDTSAASPRNAASSLNPEVATFMALRSGRTRV